MVLRRVIRSWVTPLERLGGTSLLENYGTSFSEIFLKYETFLDLLVFRRDAVAQASYRRHKPVMAQKW